MNYDSFSSLVNTGLLRHTVYDVNTTVCCVHVCVCTTLPASLSSEWFCLQLSLSVFDLPLQAVRLVGKVQLEASGSLLGRGAVPLCLL